jgi:hypothetical protein
MNHLVYKRIKNKTNDTIVLPFDATNEEGRNLVISITNKYDFKNVKNYVQIFGKSITPLVATPSTDYTNDNSSSKLIVNFNNPLYDSNNQPFTNGTDMKSFFTYTGTQNNYVSAVYNISTGYTITFTITGEQGKALIPVKDKIYNSCAINYYDDKYEFCSTDQYKWSIPNYITIDYTNNSIIKLVIKFNRPIYNSSGTKLSSGTDVKSYFSYGGTASNFTSAIYTSDDYDNAITMIFATGLNLGDTLNIVSNTIYDSAGFTINISKWTYIFNGTEWYLKTTLITSDNQIQAISQNNIAGHKFSIDAIGQRNLPIVNEKIYSLQQAESLSQYNLWCHSNMGEKVEISCVPIYMIDVNQLIYIKNNMLNIDGKYCITQISLPLKWNGIMNISCYLIYDENVI